MEIRFNPADYGHVPVLYWPWIWWQLFWLRGWCETTGRGVIYTIETSGHVSVHLVSDDRHDLRAWMYRQARVPRPHLDCCQDASGTQHLSPIERAVTWVWERTGCLIRYVWVRLVLRQAPAVQDSS